VEHFRIDSEASEPQYVYHINVKTLSTFILFSNVACLEGAEDHGEQHVEHLGIAFAAMLAADAQHIQRATARICICAFHGLGHVREYGRDHDLGGQEILKSQCPNRSSI
jgi:hypothetical protein